MTATTPKYILALDVGEKRVGVAIASSIARLPRPLTTLERGDNFFNELKAVITGEQIDMIVVGLPRGLQGQDTGQTVSTSAFVTHLKELIDLPIYLQDEALTSKKAEEELNARGGTYAKGDIDALAATYILDDFLNEHQTLEGVIA